MRRFRLLVPLIVLVSVLVPSQRADAFAQNFRITAVTADMGGGTSQEWFEVANISGVAQTDISFRAQFFGGTSCSSVIADYEWNPRSFAANEQKAVGNSAAALAGVPIAASEQYSSVSDAIQTNGTLILYQTGVGNLQDRVAWGTASTACGEGGTVEAALTSDKSLVRADRATCATDTNNTAADFTNVTPDTAAQLTNNGCDGDTDGVGNYSDNCPAASNNDQANTDGDGQGNECDDDDDNDGYEDGLDNCPLTANSDQLNTDSDGAGNACDDDDDDDGFVDGSDGCPLLADATVGCPYYARTLTLKYKSADAGFSGFLAGGPDDCWQGRLVTVFKKTSDGNKSIGSAFTEITAGKFVVVKPKKPGTYFAKIEAERISEAGDCSKAKSPKVVI
jgi:hypothetical protein